MLIKTVLLPVHVDQAEGDIVKALELCCAIGSHLSVLVISEAPSVPLSSDPVVLSENWGVLAQKARQRLSKRVNDIKVLIAESGNPASVHGVSVNEDLLGDAIAQQALYSDLVIVLRGFLTGLDVAKTIVASIISTTGKPILIANSSQLDALDAKKVVIAWDGEKPASRAISEALPILKNAEMVEILLVDPIAGQTEEDKTMGGELETYLTRHGINNSVKAVSSEGKDVADAIKQRAQQADFDLIVMGAYTHSRFRQKFFGGTTTIMVKNCETPVLMAH